MAKTLSIALRASTDHRRTLIAALILCLFATYVYGSLINAIAVLALHHQSHIALVGSFGLSGIIIGYIATSWLIVQLQTNRGNPWQ